MEMTFLLSIHQPYLLYMKQIISWTVGLQIPNGQIIHKHTGYIFMLVSKNSFYFRNITYHIRKNILSTPLLFICLNSEVLYYCA